MRIGMFSDSYLPDINGVVTSVVTLKDILEEHGHEVWVVSNHPSIMKTEFDFDRREIRLPGLEIKRLYGYKFSTPFHSKTIDRIKDLNWDLVHVHSEFGVGLFGRMVCRALRLPLVSTYHTTYEDYTHYVNAFQMQSIDKIAKTVVAKLSKLYGETSNGMIAPSQKTKDMLLRYGITTPISVVPTGLDLKRFMPKSSEKALLKEKRKEYGIRDEDLLVVYVGRIAKEKSIDMAIEAFRYIPQNDATIKFLIVGGGPDIEPLSELIKELALSDRVIMAGRQSPDVVPLFYHMSDIFVSASLSETQGLTYIEALASGLPVLGRRDEALKDIVDEGMNGYYFDDEKELANKILLFSNLDSNKRGAMQACALEAAKEYDVEVFYQRIMEVYEDTLRRFKEVYRVTDIKYQDDAVLITIANPSSEMNILISIDSFASHGIRRDQTIDSQVIMQLLDEEALVHAYRGCIRRLTLKDRTCKEMRDWLKANYPLNQEKADQLIDSLVEKGYLDDRRYAEYQIGRLVSQLMGKNRIERELMKKGVSTEIINELNAGFDNQQLQMAKSYAKKQQSRIKGRSIAFKKNMIRSKLVQYGYDYDIADEAVGSLNLMQDEISEQTILRKMAQKAKTRYNRKYQHTELRNRVFRYLITQGFNYDDIYLVINEMEWDDE